MRHPIPRAALDDRLGFVGNAGGGKTYSAGTAVERLLAAKARVVIPDPLGVWFGLALDADGKTPSVYRKREELVIFGGPRGDLPLNEYAGALIGETVAGMKESCILDLSELGTKAAERRFMLAFLTALYKHKTNEPLHVIFDEADMWAPQRVLDKEGEAMKLLGMMETVVRRGRVKGFIPWLITQRPAVLSKNVLSQVDGLVAFKLTSVQDRDAIGDWVEGQADKGQWKAMWGNMATLNRGEAVVWIPARSILTTAQFPAKETFDSSRAPKRGERVQSAAALEPVNLDKLKVRLSKVEAETKANDPKALRAQVVERDREIARLQGELTSKSTTKADPDAIKTAEERGFAQAEKKLKSAMRAYCNAEVIEVLTLLQRGFEEPLKRLDEQIKHSKKQKPELAVTFMPEAAPMPPRPQMARPAVVRTPAEPNGDSIERPLQVIVDAIRWWNVLGVPTPSHAQAGFIAGYSHKSGTWATYLSRLRSMGLIEGRGDLVLTIEGFAAAHDLDAPPTGEHLRGAVLAKVDGPLKKILIPILEAYPDGLSHADAGERSGYSPTSGTWATYLSRLRSLDLIDGRGELKAQDWLFPMERAA